MPYTIKLENGKYLIKNDNGSLTILRHGEDWPAADQLKHDKLVHCLAQRIEELETQQNEDTARWRFLMLAVANPDGPEGVLMTRLGDEMLADADAGSRPAEALTALVDAARSALAK